MKKIKILLLAITMLVAFSPAVHATDKEPQKKSVTRQDGERAGYRKIKEWWNKFWDSVPYIHGISYEQPKVELPLKNTHSC